MHEKIESLSFTLPPSPAPISPPSSRAADSQYEHKQLAEEEDHAR